MMKIYNEYIKDNLDLELINSMITNRSNEIFFNKTNNLGEKEKKIDLH